MSHQLENEFDSHCMAVVTFCDEMSAEDTTDDEWYDAQHNAAVEWEIVCGPKFEAFNGRAGEPTVMFEKALTAVRASF